MNFFEKTQLCKCPTIEIRNQVIAVLNKNNIPFEKKVKRDKFSLKNINIKQGKFGLFYMIYASKNDYDNAKKLLKENKIETDLLDEA